MKMILTSFYQKSISKYLPICYQDWHNCQRKWRSLFFPFSLQMILAHGGGYVTPINVTYFNMTKVAMRMMGSHNINQIGDSPCKIGATALIPFIYSQRSNCNLNFLSNKSISKSLPFKNSVSPQNHRIWNNFRCLSFTWFCVKFGHVFSSSSAATSTVASICFWGLPSSSSGEWWQWPPMHVKLSRRGSHAR